MAKKKPRLIKGKEKGPKKDQGIVKAMLEARVPSACYELSVKPASHPTFKNESG